MRIYSLSPAILEGLTRQSPPSSSGDLFALANAGLAVGAFSFGLLVDVIGRRWAFNLTCLITSVFGMLLVSLANFP